MQMPDSRGSLAMTGAGLGRLRCICKTQRAALYEHKKACVAGNHVFIGCPIGHTGKEVCNEFNVSGKNCNCGEAQSINQNE